MEVNSGNGIVKNSVAFLMPIASGVESRTWQSSMCVANFATAHGYMVRQIGCTERTLIHSAREMLAVGFLQSECEWAFWMDADMVLEPRTIPVMIETCKAAGVKVATGVYFQRIGEHKPLIFLRDPVTLDGKRLHPKRLFDDYSHSHVVMKEGTKTPFKVDAAGFGCFLTHREAFEKLNRPWFRNHFFKTTAGEEKEISEDFYFCVKARAAGLDILAVPELQCGHIGQGPIITQSDFVRPEEKLIAPVKVEAVGIGEQYEQERPDDGCSTGNEAQL